MRKLALIPLLALLAACGANNAPIPPNEAPLAPEVEAAALQQLQARGEIESSPQACISDAANPLAGPTDSRTLTFAEGLWQVESRRSGEPFASEDQNSFAIASIEKVSRGYGYVEYYAGGWGGTAFFETTFWGAAGFGNRWAVVETNNISNDIATLSGNFRAGEESRFLAQGQMFSQDVSLRLTPVDSDHFTWELLSGDGDDARVIWSRSYTRITAEQQPAALQQAMGGLALQPAPAEMEQLSFWLGDWDWYEHHIDLGRDCAEGQASVNLSNNGQAIEERVISAYDPAEANFETYADYSLAVWHADGEFEVVWWTNGFIDGRMYRGLCTGSGADKVCQLRAEFRPSANENTIAWEVQGTQIDWVRVR